MKVKNGGGGKQLYAKINELKTKGKKTKRYTSREAAETGQRADVCGISARGTMLCDIAATAEQERASNRAQERTSRGGALRPLPVFFFPWETGAGMKKRD